MYLIHPLLGALYTYTLKFEEAFFFDHVEVLLVDVVKGLDIKVDEVSMLHYTDHMKVVYPKA